MRALFLVLACLLGLSAAPVRAWPVHGYSPCTHGVGYVNPYGANDGCAGAQMQDGMYVGAGFQPTFFTDTQPSGNPFWTRPSWSVAGVDFNVGHNPNLTLKDASQGFDTAFPGCVYTNDTATGYPNVMYIRCVVTTNVDIEGWDFSNGRDQSKNTVPGNCIYLFLTAGVHNITMKNNKFARGPGCYAQPLVSFNGGSGTRTIMYNTIDGGSQVLGDNQYDFHDNEDVTIGSPVSARYWYNYCIHLQGQCFNGQWNGGVSFRYNFIPGGNNSSESWNGGGGGTATLSADGTTLTINSVASNDVPPTTAQILKFGSTNLGNLDSCSGFGVGETCLLHTAHPEAAGGPSHSFNTLGPHFTYVFMTNAATTTFPVEYAFNTGSTLTSNLPGMGTSNFEVNSANNINNIYQSVTIANNTMVTNASFFTTTGNGSSELETNLFYWDIYSIQALNLTDNFFSPPGATYCTAITGIIGTMNGTIDNGSGNGTTTGNILTVTSVPVNPPIAAGGIVYGGPIPNDFGTPPIPILRILPYHTQGTTGTGGTGTYALYDANTGALANVAYTFTGTGSNAGHITGATGIVQSNGTVTGVNVTNNVNMLSSALAAGQTDITLAGQLNSMGHCYGKNH